MRGKLTALLVIGVLGCGKDGPGAAGSGGAVVIDKFRIGRIQAADGSAAVETDIYSVGETIYVSFEVKNAPSGSPVRLVFSSLPDGRGMAELENKTARKGLVGFELKDTKGWPPGTYRVEYFLLEGSKRLSLGIHDFKLMASPPPRTG
jgi:hypothetical protein